MAISYGRRAPARLLAALAVAWLSVSVAHAQDPWYKSYEDGVAAFNKNDYPAAQRKLEDAIKAGPKTRGPRILYYGQRRGEFFPEYYLSRILVTQHRYAEALEYAKAAAGYLHSGDKGFAELATARAEAEKNLAAPKSPLEADARTSAGAPAAGRGTPAAPERSAAADAGRGTQPPGTGGAAAPPRAAEPTQVATATPAGSAAGATAAGAAGSGVAAGRGASAGVSGAPAATSAGAAASAARVEAQRQERLGMTEFYRGNYQQALDVFRTIPADLASPRVVLYRACSTAALALLLDGDRQRAALARARDLFASARPYAAAYSSDRKYISPNILQAIENGAR